MNIKHKTTLKNPMLVVFFIAMGFIFNLDVSRAREIDDYGLYDLNNNSGKPAVIFIHGWNDHPAAWIPISRELALYSRFMDDYHVYTFTFNSLDPIMDDGKLLKDEINNAGITKPYIVAHSMGGLIARSYVTQGGELAKLVTLGTPHRGASTSLCGPWSPISSVQDMCEKTDFIKDLNDNTIDIAHRHLYVLWGGEKEDLQQDDGETNLPSTWLCQSLAKTDCDQKWRYNRVFEYQYKKLKDIISLVKKDTPPYCGMSGQEIKCGQLDERWFTACGYTCDNKVSERYYIELEHAQLKDANLNPDIVAYLAYQLPYLRTKNAAIQGHNKVQLINVTPADCAKACNERTDFTCKSFDYHKDARKCDLSDKRASDVSGGLKTGYHNNPYDHYSKDLP